MDILILDETGESDDIVRHHSQVSTRHRFLYAVFRICASNHARSVTPISKAESSFGLNFHLSAAGRPARTIVQGCTRGVSTSAMWALHFTSQAVLQQLVERFLPDVGLVLLYSRCILFILLL